MNYKNACKVLLLFFAVMLCAVLNAQSELGGFSSVDKDDGMFHNNIRYLFEDSKSFLWIGTTDGLMRYDGSFYDLFRKDKTKSSTLSSNYISVIKEDHFSYALWLGSNTGNICKFSVHEEKFENFILPPTSNNRSGIVRITAFEQIGRDRMLVATQNQGLYIFQPSIKKFEPLKRSKRLTSNSSILLPQNIYNVTNNNHYIWVISNEGVIKLSSGGAVMEDNYFSQTKFPFLYNAAGKSLIRDIYSKSPDIIAFSCGGSIYEYNLSAKELNEIYKSKHDFICHQIKGDHNNNYWLTTPEYGVYYYNSETGKLSHHTAQVNSSNALLDNKVNSICHNAEQQITWLGTSKGISKYDYNATKFKQFNLDSLGKSNADIFLLAKDSKGGYWLKDSQRCFYKGSSDTQFAEFSHLASKEPTDFTEDSQNNFFIATKEGLYVHSLETGKTTHQRFYDLNLDEEKLNDICNLTIVNDSICWLVSHSGLIQYNASCQDYTVYAFPKEIFGETSYYYSSITAANDGKSIWFASRRGKVFKFDVNSLEFTSEIVLKEDADIISSILDIEFDVNGKMWIATYGDGILIYDFETKRLSTEMAVDILESQVYSVVSDRDKNLWLSASFGIAKINPITLKATYFTSADGTFCDEFNADAYYRTHQNEFLFGGGDRFISFHPDSMRYNTYDAPVEINSWQVDDKVSSLGGDLYDEVCYNTVDPIEFKQTKHALRIYAAVLNYSNSLDNMVKWRLRGFDDHWKYGYAVEPIIYHNLDPGKYTLEVRGINSDGYQSKNVAKLDIRVKAPFLGTLFFKILVGLLAAYVIYLLVQFRLAWYQRQEQILTEKVNNKTKELTDAYKELEQSREEIYNQKGELEIHRNYLEDIVEERTKDLQAAKLKAEESDRLKTSFLANLSHEIRTPMNAIIGFSSLLQTDEFPEEQRKEFLSVVHQSSESLLVLINDIIDISRIETGNIQLVRNTIVIPDLIQELLGELVFEEKSENVKLNLCNELGEDDINFYTDRFRLKQILSNLLRNAFKFTEDGFIDLKLSITNGQSLSNMGFEMNGNASLEKALLISVADSGIGIPPEHLEIIFEPFRKAYTEFKFYKGMGLGLSIVKNLINILQGDIIVDSKLGEGTTFTMYLELVEEEIVKEIES